MSLLPQFGFFEFLLLAVVALVVVGPEDLPVLMRSFGRLVSRCRLVAREFSDAFTSMSDGIEMEKLRRQMHDPAEPDPAGTTGHAGTEGAAPAAARSGADGSVPMKESGG